MEDKLAKRWAREERIRKLMVRPGAYYDSSILRAYNLGKRFPNYRIQIDPNVKQLILEYCDGEPGYFPQSIIDRFEEMDEGFEGVRCFQAEEDAIAKKGDDDFFMVDPDLVQYGARRGERMLLAKIASSQGDTISSEEASMIRNFEEQFGDLLEYYLKNHPEILKQYMAKYKTSKAAV